FHHFYAGRELLAGLQPGWTHEALEEFRQAAEVRDPAEDVAGLRSDVITCLGSLDARLTASLGKHITPTRLAWHPHGKWIALGIRASLAIPSAAVTLVDPRDPGRTRALRFRPLWIERGTLSYVPDVVTALAFSPDGRWLIAGMRSGQLHRWDLTAQGNDPVS